MITCIREVRRAKGLTLQDVADRCTPPTTAQTIGRLETGTRTVSVGWLNRIAAALGAEAADLVQLPATADLAVAAVLDGEGAHAPRSARTALAPRPEAGTVALAVTGSVGEYRAGDVVWCRRIAPDHFAEATNRDVLVPRPAGRFVFGRLIGRDGDRLHVLAPGAGTRQQVITAPPWAAIAIRLVRELG